MSTDLIIRILISRLRFRSKRGKTDSDIIHHRDSSRDDAVVNVIYFSDL